MTDNSRTRDRLLALAEVRHDISTGELLAQARVVTGMSGDTLTDAMADLCQAFDAQTELSGDPAMATAILDDGDSWRDPVAAAEAELDRRISDALRRLGA